IHDIIMGVSYLHSVNIVHGDLCGVSAQYSCQCVTDFELAAFIELETSIKSSTHGGSTWWMAPDLLLLNVYSPDLSFHCTIKFDVWAFMCL
ncbi:hypothetical protein B0H14DRAFT_2261496, partial [Mycena olivaceomarginata]